MNETFVDFLQKIDIDVTQEFRQDGDDIRTFGQTQMENMAVFGHYKGERIPGSFAISPKKLIELVSLSPDGKFTLDNSILSFGNDGMNMQFRLENVGDKPREPKAVYQNPSLILTKDVSARILKMQSVLDSEKVVIDVKASKASLNIVGVIDGSKGSVSIPYPGENDFTISFGKSFYTLIRLVKNDDGVKLSLGDKMPLQLDLETPFYKIVYILLPQKR